ncbi:MAG: PcfJ domain-containing protein, partial [Campylobacterota bacterium]|nr:PcfJ domain-containing protein [Campylobacterota bacterium]
PNKIDLSCDEISFLQKNIFQISIDSYGNIDEILFANFKLDQFKYDNWFDFDDYSTQEDITSNHPILSNYKKRILSEIIKNRYFNFSDNIVKNIETLEQVSFFAYSKHLKEFDFYYWEKIGFLPSNQNLTINDALRYVANSRKEKSLKKAIFENYQEQMIDKSYYFLYPYCIAKYIKDINIANRLIDLDLNMYFKEIVNHNSLELFLIYLVKHYSDKQIENLFKSYKKQEMFWFLDTVELFAELSAEMRNNFVKVSCKYNILHDEIITYHRLAMHERLLDTTFNYTQKQLDAIKFIEPYDIRLPQHGLELYNWSTALSNCLAGYSNLIKKYQTIIYGFCKNDEISFAVEIKDNKIIQAKSKYNNDLSKEDMDIVIHWYKEFILKEDKEL